MIRTTALFRAIRVARDGKSRPLHVQRYSRCSAWSQEDDAGWLSYRKAMNFLVREHPKLLKLLKMVRYL